MKICNSSPPSSGCTRAATRRAARLETVVIPHHDLLSLPYSGAATFPDHANRDPPHLSRTAVDKWRFAFQLRKSHTFMAVPHYKLIFR